MELISLYTSHGWLNLDTPVMGVQFPLWLIATTLGVAIVLRATKKVRTRRFR